MTTYRSIEVKCVICGKTSNHKECTSTNTFGGAYDLDARPPEMRRSTMNTWVQVCPSCGYCTPDISLEIAKASEVVHSKLYQRQLKKSKLPKLANAFLCCSLIEENAGDYTEASLHTINAAWACDDAKLKAGGKKCREKAVSLLKKAKENGQVFAQQIGLEESIFTDVLRRSNQFEFAMTTCKEGLKRNPEKIISDILNYQKTLISKLDTACHKVSEISGYTEKR